eukprot:TRINITY_DN2358_c0_g1_i11.p1 TRINITY_DN2358_c0_g1~~TRINITY_DN2358_c0_g1_i11.p1  ORF type:complete len:495 (-),score=95.47 TRINITY_DN2358_c0_g1_i11:242-1726(-)
MRRFWGHRKIAFSNWSSFSSSTRTASKNYERTTKISMKISCKEKETPSTSLRFFVESQTKRMRLFKSFKMKSILSMNSADNRSSNSKTDTRSNLEVNAVAIPHNFTVHTYSLQHSMNMHYSNENYATSFMLNSTFYHSDLEENLEQKDSQLRVAQAELASLKEFKTKRHEVQEELVRARKDLEEFERKHQETISKMEHKFYEEKVRLQKETNQKMAEIQKLSHEEAIQRLDESTKQILIENRRMADELRLQVQETDELQRAKKRMEEENERLLRSVELNEQSVKEYAKQGYRRAKEIKDLTNKVKNLERSLGQVVRELEREKESSSQQMQKLAEQSQAEINALKRLLELKAKELSGIRKLAQNVLNQRTELERFFLEALEQCKQEITLRRSGSGSSRKKDMSGFQAQRVDVSELTWEDRERILRLLFSKMSSNGTSKQMQNTLPSSSVAHMAMASMASHHSGSAPLSAPATMHMQFGDGDTFLTDGAANMLSDL